MFILVGGVLAIAFSTIVHGAVTTELGYEIISLELFISILVSLWAVLLPSFFSLILAIIHSFFLGSAFYAENISSVYYFIGGFLGMIFVILILISVRKGIKETRIEYYLQRIHQTYFGKFFLKASKGIITFCILYDALTLFSAFKLIS